MAGIDTIHFSVPLSQSNEDHLRLKGLIDQVYSRDNRSGVDWNWGNLGNLRVSVSRTNLKIVGSLSRYINGPMNGGLGYHETKTALQKLGNHLSLNLNKGRISRLDIAGDLILGYSVGDYLPGIKPSFKNSLFSEYKSGILFRNSGKVKNVEVVYYDKVEELYRKVKQFPAVNENILRYEMRMYRPFLKNKGLPLYIEELGDAQKFNDLLLTWEGRFVNAHKKLVLRKPLDMMTNTPKTWVLKELLNFIVMDGREKELVVFMRQRLSNTSTVESSNPIRQKKRLNEEVRNVEDVLLEDNSNLILEMVQQVKSGGIDICSL